MSVSSFRIDDAVKNETVRIADKLGLSFDDVIEICLKQFNRNKGFSEPLRLEDELKSLISICLRGKRSLLCSRQYCAGK